MHELNITPLMDLVMVLLVIFMITTPQLSNDLDLNLPTAQPNRKPPNQRPRMNYVDVDSQGHLKVNEQSADETELPALFASIHENEGTNASVVIRGADDVPYQRVITVIDLLQRADIEKVGLGFTKPK